MTSLICSVFLAGTNIIFDQNSDAKSFFQFRQILSVVLSVEKHDII